MADAEHVGVLPNCSTPIVIWLEVLMTYKDEVLVSQANDAKGAPLGLCELVLRLEGLGKVLCGLRI